MARFLMDLCFKYKNSDCKVNEVKNARRASEIKEAGEIPLFPYGEAQERLDQICEKCKDRMFEIQESVCPVCQGGLGPALISEWQAGSMKVYQYRCAQCDSLLYSHKKIT